MVRKAQSKDIPRIAEILIFAKRAAYRPIFQNDEVSFNEMQVVSLAKELSREGAIEQIAVYDDGIVRGVMRRGITEEEDCPGGMELFELYVDPFFQGMGIGSRLMEYFLKEAGETSRRQKLLWVLEKNDNARRFYERSGFAPDGHKKVWPGTSQYLLRYARV